jgi:hypothetical protein
MLSVEVLYLALLCVLLTLLLLLLGFFCGFRFEGSNSMTMLAENGTHSNIGSILFWSDHFPLYGLFVIRSSACGAQAVHVRFDVVEAELAYLRGHHGSVIGHGKCDIAHLSKKDTTRRSMVPGTVCRTYLIAARTWSEVTIREIELFHAEWAR